MSKAKQTTDHDTIRKWVEQRDGQPATVADTSDDGAGILRIDFGEPDAELEPIDWDAFFAKFEQEHLAFLYQEQDENGAVSRFCKFVERR